MCWLALVGCAADEPDHATEDSELVFGTVTGRPEIGRISSSVGTCTATLISSNAILTAAHCVGANASLIGVPPGATFFFRDAAGTQRSVPIDRVHAFNFAPFGPVANTLGTDVAIARLAIAVPPSQATPATIATRPPVTGETSTMFGFGCVDRIFGGGVGTQRAFTFPFGNVTTSICDTNDHGGPIVFGTAGPIWGVAQGVTLLVDGYSDVASHAKEIEAVQRFWGGRDEPNTDRMGLDYFVEIAANAAVCRSGCERDARCRAFSFRASDNHCWRKHGVQDPTPGAGITSGLPTRFEQSTDRLGGDFASLPIGAPDLCAAACARTGGCLSWTTFNGSCFLKNAVPPATPCVGCTSGVIPRAFEPDTDRPGGDIANHTASTPGQCASLCARNYRCLAFTHAGLACALKGSVPTAVAVSPGLFMTSGVRRGIEPEIDRPGGDYLSLNVAPVPRVCQAMCATDDRCVAWALFPSGSYGRCVLKSSAGTGVFSSGAVSGLKGLEFLPPM